MDIEINDKNLILLYETGKSNKYKLPKEIIKKFYMSIETIEAANNIFDLRNYKSLNFEKLKGTDQYSIRLNIKYRMILKVKWVDDNNEVGIFEIIDINNHYSR